MVNEYEKEIARLRQCLNEAHKLINPTRLEESIPEDFLLQLRMYVEESNEYSKACYSLKQRIAELENGFHEIYEEYAGMDGCASETVVEAYYYRIIENMAAIASRYKFSPPSPNDK